MRTVAFRHCSDGESCLCYNSRVSKKSTGKTTGKSMRTSAGSSLKQRASKEVRSSARVVIKKYGKALRDLEKY